MKRIQIAVLAVLAGVLCAGCVGLTPSAGDESPSNGTEDDLNEPIPEDTVGVFDVRAELVDRYEPGTCEGMPSPVSEEMMNRTIEQNEALTDKICENSDEEKSDREMYGLIVQFQQVQVTEQSNGVYQFTVRDANCCTTTIIEGEYNPETGTVTETESSTENQPC